MDDKDKKRLPRQVETRDEGLIYDSVNDEWMSAYQSVFRPNPDSAAINISSAGTHTIIPGVSGKSIRIISIAFTVGELTAPDTVAEITFLDGDWAISGPMQFSGDSQPRGIVIPFPYSPLGLSDGDSFIISVDVDVQVSGMVCYFYQ